MTELSIINIDNIDNIDKDINKDFITYSRNWLYILHNIKDTSTYNGFTVNFKRRLRQHNTEITGGAQYTSKLVKRKGIVWIPLAIIRVPDNYEFEIKRALSVEWSIRFCTNKKPRPLRYNGAIGRLHGMALVFDNPKFMDLVFHVNVFSSESFDILTNALTPSSKERVTVEYIKDYLTICN